MRSLWFWVVLIGLTLAVFRINRTSIAPIGGGLAFASGVAPRPSAATPPAVAPPGNSRALRIAELLPDLAAEGRPWLMELNKWRQMAGLAPSVANTALSQGSERHARYLVNRGPVSLAGFRIYDRTIGPGAHIEDKGARWYTAEGAEAAQGGRLTADVIQCADVAWEGRDERVDIDQLLLAPFHRFSLMAPWGVVAGYGSYGEYPRRAAALALRGPIDRGQNAIVEFPPDKSEIPWTAMVGSEWPNPLAACPGYAAPVGVPITVQNGGRLDLTSYSLRDQDDGKELTACALDATSYRDDDPVQRRRGRDLLAAYGAIVLIPRHPLRAGDHYRVEIDARQADFAWSFGVNPFDQPAAHPIVVRSASVTPAREPAAKLSSR
jgi:hypothetical protein